MVAYQWTSNELALAKVENMMTSRYDAIALLPKWRVIRRRKLLWQVEALAELQRHFCKAVLAENGH